MALLRPALFPLGNIIGIPVAWQQNTPDREHLSSAGSNLDDYSRTGIDAATTELIIMKYAIG
jgi:hypothetical protein